jgi:hypothetical protein
MLAGGYPYAMPRDILLVEMGIVVFDRKRDIIFVVSEGVLRSAKLPWALMERLILVNFSAFFN